MMKFFHSVTSKEEAKKLYRKLAKENHPDIGGDTETMKVINNEYDEVIERLSRGEKVSEGFNQQEANEQYRNIIDSLLKYDDLNIEIIGTWIWVTGNTYPVRKILGKDGLGFKWSENKKAWYWHEGEYHKMHKKSFSMDEIKQMHDVKTIRKSKSALA